MADRVRGTAAASATVVAPAAALADGARADDASHDGAARAHVRVPRDDEEAAADGEDDARLHVLPASPLWESSFARARGWIAAAMEEVEN